ncbi:MAG TPA: DUF1015 family protein [Candidatus Aminicenantes bacterium]|nr:DUF1015 family protein [Candidatus Aminicenantes bacterium]HRY64925.1 DUF1015 family protein [Candidatus Aminicenantes bacterium]HRZ71838.1 DUF1015 family protein [Candidatus Aminicenantes bacterium]
MAHIRPFRGVRPRKDIAHLVAAPPYDVLTSEEARQLAAGNPYSFLHVGKPEIDLPPGTDLYSDAVYAKGKENFERFRREGTIVQDPTRDFYVYKQVWGDHVQIGLVAAASCRDYLDDVIKKHELTRVDKENDRMRHIETLGAQTGPVFLTYRQNGAVDALVAEAMARGPEVDITTYDQVRHIFYVVDDPGLVARIQAAFAALPFLYVADGHHRSAAATRIKVRRDRERPSRTGEEEDNFFLAVIFPHSQMKILPYNRVVRDLNGLAPEAFLARLAEKFTVTPDAAPVPAAGRTYAMFLGGRWYGLAAKPGSYDPADPIGSLDVSVLQTNLLGPVLGIADPRTDKRIDFVGGIRGTGELEKKVRSGQFAAAFSLAPTTIEQLFAVADAGRIMPPKSTWFEPKLKDGLVVHMIDE